MCVGEGQNSVGGGFLSVANTLEVPGAVIYLRAADTFSPNTTKHDQAGCSSQGGVKGGELMMDVMVFEYQKSPLINSHKSSLSYRVSPGFRTPNLSFLRP